MYRISEFAYLCGTTTKTLRFYDSIGLLKADHTDTQNGYRYYSEDKVQVFYKITSLKRLGFTLDKIRDSLIDADDATILKLLKQKEQVLYNAYRSCRKIISIYEERLKMSDEEKNAKVEIGIDEGESSITLSEGKTSTKIYCNLDNLYDCRNVFDDMLNSATVNIDFADIYAHIDRENHVDVGLGVATTRYEIIDAVEQALGDTAGVKTLMFRCEMSSGVQLDNVDELSGEVSKRLDSEAAIVWTASFIEGIEEFIRITAIKFY